MPYPGLKEVHLCGHIHTRSPPHNCCRPQYIKFVFIIFIKPALIECPSYPNASFLHPKPPCLSLNAKSRSSGCSPTIELHQFSSSPKCSRSSSIHNCINLPIALFTIFPNYYMLRSSTKLMYKVLLNFGVPNHIC